jgi:hypothetical protein
MARIRAGAPQRGFKIGVLESSGSDQIRAHRIASAQSAHCYSTVGRLAVRRCRHRQSTDPTGIACWPSSNATAGVLRRPPEQLDVYLSARGLH